MLSRGLSTTSRIRPSNFRLFRRYFYDSRTKNDTIFASASHIAPSKGSPLVVVRVSGCKCAQVVKKITGFNLLRDIDGKVSEYVTQPTSKVVKPRHATMLGIRNPETNETIDRGIILWFPSPKSYTGEDVCEFHLHGSRAIVTSLLNTLGNFKGLRPADPGEFTRRAVLNGKMSLLQAESLPDLIASQTEYQRKLSFRGLDGATRQKYESWIARLVHILAHLEASIDFGEDELIGEERVVRECSGQIQDLSSEIFRFIEIGNRSRELSQNGARVAILGKPNSGKSTLMNLLCRREKSIVSDLSGTTRDIVEHSFEFGGHLITLCDTAGLKSLYLSSSLSPALPPESLLEKHDKIEQEGIRRALDIASRSDIIVYMIDGGRLSNDPIELVNTVMSELNAILKVMITEMISRNIHLVINKIDLNDKLLDHSFVESLESTLRKHSISEGYNILTSFISCATQENFNNLERQLTSLIESTICPKPKESEPNRLVKEQELEYVNERHLALLKSTHGHLNLAEQLNIKTIDEMAQHVRESVNYLSRIVGAVSSEQVFDIIFRDFCIGK